MTLTYNKLQVKEIPKVISIKENIEVFAVGIPGEDQINLMC